MKKLGGLSFSAKIVLIVFLAVLPMVAITLVSMYELKLSTDGRQMALIENNFDQAHRTLEEKMEGVHAISTLMTVNEPVNTALRSASKEDMRQQLSSFEAITSYVRNIEMSHEGTRVYLFVDDECAEEKQPGNPSPARPCAGTPGGGNDGYADVLR